MATTDRNTFLIEWYKILWNNARSSMDGVWKLIGPITIVGTIWIAIQKGYLEANLGYSLAFIILLWGINITIDFNQWHRRNLIIFSAVEREFLKDEDYGKLIPKDFREPKLEWISFYKICCWVFCLILLISVWQALLHTCDYKWYEQYHWLFLLTGIPYTFCYYNEQEKSTKKYYKEIFVKKIE